MPRLTRAAIGSAALLLGGAQSVATAQEQLVVRAATGVTPQAERLLAESVLPRVLDLQEGDDLLAAARRVCGRLTPEYISILAEANGGLIQSDSQVTIPGCFVVRINETVPVLENESLEDVAKREVGIAGPVTVKDIIGNSPSVASGTITLATAGRPLPNYIESVVLPVTTEAVAYQTSAGLDAEALAKRLGSALGPRNPVDDALVTDPVFNLEASVSNARQDEDICPLIARSRIEDSSWPFPASEVRATINGNRVGSLVRTTIAVVDNGMDGIFGDHFPMEDFKVNQLELKEPYDGEDQSGSKYADDVSGTNIHIGGMPIAYASAPTPSHGTIMASLALGGQEYRDLLRLENEQSAIQIIPISILRRNIVTGPPNRESFSLPVNGLRKAIEYGAFVKASIFSLSVSTRAELQGVHDALYNQQNLLLVVAAGNTPENLDEGSRVYPASYSRTDENLRGRVIAVAAHNRKGCLSGFSGRGQESVDLAAPGVEITGIGFNGEVITDQGTSHATALVAFAAAQLQSLGLTGAAAIKERLNASVDFDPNLAQWLRSGGTLNLVKAASLFQDVVELSTRDELQFGGFSVQAKPISVRDVCPTEAKDVRRVLKVSRIPQQAGEAVVRVLVRNGNDRGPAASIECVPHGELMTFNTVNGALQFVWSEVIDFVPRV